MVKKSYFEHLERFADQVGSARSKVLPRRVKPLSGLMFSKIIVLSLESTKVKVPKYPVPTPAAPESSNSLVTKSRYEVIPA